MIYGLGSYDFTVGDEGKLSLNTRSTFEFKGQQRRDRRCQWDSSGDFGSRKGVRETR